jgi:hypothetical protein
MAVCDVPGCTEHYACSLRAKGVAIASAAIPNRIRNKPNRVPPRAANPSWERGIAGERRSDGSFMPYRNDHGSQMGVKEAGERRHEIEAIRHKQRHDPNYATPAALRG